jgi:sugar/nucleoside kinase (ribokinase family)
VRERATGTTYDIAVIGNYTKDTIVSGEGTRMVDGGGFNYGAVAAAKTGLRVAAVTRLAKEDFYVVDALEAAGVDVFPTATPRSTHMRLEYRTSNVDERVLSVTQHAGAYTADQFRDLSARVFLINASTRGEVPLDVIAYLRKKAPLLAADVQAFVRVIATDGTLVYESWPERDEVLSMMDVLKADSKEAELLTGECGLEAQARGIADLGPKEVVLTHREGVLVHEGGRFHRERFHPKRLVGRSGRGDTCIGSYLARRLSASPAEATGWAAALTSLKMEAEGPFAGQASDVERLLARAYGQRDRQ